MTTPLSPTGIIDFFLHPPLWATSPILDHYGPYTGNNEIDHYSETPGPSYTPQTVSQTAGVIVRINGPIPPEWGQDQGWVSDDAQYDQSIFIPPIGQLVVQHRFVVGMYATTQVESITTDPQLVLWTHAVPIRIGLLVAPGFALDLFFVQLGGTP